MLERLPEFVGNHPILSLMFIGLLGTLIYTEIARKFRRYAEVNSAQLTMLINRHDATVLDVSALNDYEKGHIVNALHIAASQVDPDAKPLAGLKDKPLAVYCRTGMTAEQVCSRLSKQGFNQLYCLKGGLQAWISDQLPVTKGK